MKYIDTGDSLINMNHVIFIEKTALSDVFCIKYHMDKDHYILSEFSSKKVRDFHYEEIKKKVLWKESYGLCP